MSKVIKVTMEFDDKIQVVEGKDAEIWLDNANAACSIADAHGMNPFNKNPTNWIITPKTQQLAVDTTIKKK